MCKKLIFLVSFVLVLGSVSNAEDIKWTDLGADHLWSNPDNWDLGRAPAADDDVLIDVPAAAAPNGPVIEDGIAAECHGIWTEAPGEPTLTITGGSLVVGDWIWWGDGDGSFGIWTMSGGTVDVADEFELGWGGGAGTLTLTGGTINAGKVVIPTGSGAFGELFLNGGTYSVTKADGLQVKANGLIDITEGALVLEGDDTAKVNDLIAAGQITAYGGAGNLELDFDARNPGKTTLTASREPATGPIRLDVGNSHNAEELEEGFTSFTFDDSGSDVDGITVEFGGINSGDARRRGDPAGVPFENIYRDFIFGRQSAPGVGYVSVTLSGLQANESYLITLYSWDVGSKGIRIADWTANGAVLFSTIHDGAVDPPAAEDDFAYTAAVTTDENGTILMEAVPGEGTLGDAPFAFINALEVKLDPTVVLFAEDFEGLPLGPNVDETLAGDVVWTDTPPEGWTVDESGIPGIGAPATDGVTEWAGWAFADKAWWIEAAEDQDRSLFELGSGTVAVADPDEWDDADRLPIPISADPYDTWLTTPAIDIFGLEAGTLKLKFDSSWRPEFDDNYRQTASITASFDGGGPVSVLLWESDSASDNFHPYATNETVVVDLDVPEGASSVVLEFGLFDAGNDWWWAIDNVEVTGIPREKIVVLSEDFEGLALGPNVDEAVVGDAVWTDTPPEGWAVDESGIPGIADPATDGVTEWAGWAFADKAWWTETAGDQNRSQFVLGSGTVAIADPDEWDDAAHDDSAAAGWYKTFLSTPATDISGLEAGSLRLTFDSSWRPEFDSNYQQTANITASFDGGDPVEVLLWESDSGSANFKPDSTNETVVVNLQNPAGATSVVLTFGLFDAGNDWWWAIDNVEVSGFALPEPVDPGTDGLVAFYALDGDANDGSGNELHGTIAGDPAFVEGLAGMALELDGVDDYVDCGNPTLLDFGTGDFTISAWIKMTATERGTVYAKGGDNGGGIRYTLAMGESNDNKMTLTTDDDDSKKQAKGGTVVNDGAWHHVVGMRSGNTSLVYVDGVEDGTLDLPDGYDLSGTTQHNALLGAITSHTDGSLEKLFAGLLDEVAIYDRALSVGEVRYLAGHRAQAATDASLVIYYSFDEVSDIVADQSGKGRDGVVVGDVTAEANGMYGGAANFATGSYLDLDGPSVPAENIPTSAMTLAAWIKLANTGGDHEIFSARASDESWLIHPEPKSSGDIRWLLRSYGGTTIFQIRAGTVTWDEWLHFAGTYDKESAKAALYINGELIEEMDVASPADIAGDWDLGARVGLTIDNGRPFTGLMDEFRMYTRALSHDEVIAIMEGP